MRWSWPRRLIGACNHCDEQLVGQCELLRSMVDRQDGGALLAKISDLEAGLEAIRATLNNRAAALS